MITSKDRAKLKSLVNKENSVCIVGKDGLTPSCLKGIGDALKAREVVKISLLASSTKDAQSVADEIANALECEIVGVIGKKILAYKLNPNNKKHAL